MMESNELEELFQLNLDGCQRYRTRQRSELIGEGAPADLCAEPPERRWQRPGENCRWCRFELLCFNNTRRDEVASLRRAAQGPIGHAKSYDCRELERLLAAIERDFSTGILHNQGPPEAH
jgi:hypothetical protein